MLSHAEVVPLKKERQAGVSDGRRMQHWMMVQLRDRCSHLLLLHSSAAAGARAGGPSRQEKKVWGRAGEGGEAEEVKHEGGT